MPKKLDTKYTKTQICDQIAEATERPEGTVKAQLHRGLKRLRELLEGAPG